MERIDYINEIQKKPDKLVNICDLPLNEDIKQYKPITMQQIFDHFYKERNPEFTPIQHRLNSYYKILQGRNIDDNPLIQRYILHGVEDIEPSFMDVGKRNIYETMKLVRDFQRYKKMGNTYEERKLRERDLKRLIDEDIKF